MTQSDFIPEIDQSDQGRSRRRVRQNHRRRRQGEIHIVATGPDIARGWGMRQSVAEDFLYDYPVQLGSLRAGPDLANIGVRDPDVNWQLVHLYAPQSVVKGSAMPPFRYLFEVRKIGGANLRRTPCNFRRDSRRPPVMKSCRNRKRSELAAYLLSLRANVPLYSAPFSP